VLTSSEITLTGLGGYLYVVAGGEQAHGGVKGGEGDVLGKSLSPILVGRS